MSTDKLVELIPVEKFFYHGTVLGDEYVIGIAITSANDIMLNDDLIKEAMYYLYKRHPLFRAHIHVDSISKKIYFAIPTVYEKTADEMKFQRCRLSSRSDLTREIERFSVQCLDYKSKVLLWGLEVMEYEQNEQNIHVFVLSVPMYMTDGVNITALTIELINIVNSLMQNKKCQEMIQSLDLVDDVEKIIEKYNLAGDKYREDFEKNRKNKPQINFQLPNSFKNNDYGYKINLLPLEVELTRKLVAYAKKNEIKVNSILTTAFYYALKELYAENGIRIQKDVTMYVMVNLRFRVEPNIDFSHVRDYATGFGLELEYPSFGKYENMLDDCKYVEKEVKQNIKDCTMFDWILNGQDEIFDDTDLKTVYAEHDAARVCDFLMSNTGTWVADRKKVLDGPIKIDELYYGDSLKSFPTMNIPFILHIHTFNERLMIQLSSNRTRINSIYSDRFIILFEKYLRKF
jgi:hypothetical protein